MPKNHGPHAIHRLSHLMVKNTRKPGHYADGGNLYLQIGPGGAKTWLFKYRLNGRSREMGLGPLHTIDLEAARAVARIHREELLANVDPIEARHASRRESLVRQAAQSERKTWKWCCETYVADVKIPELTNAKHAAQWGTTLATYTYPKLGAKAVDEITLHDPTRMSLRALLHYLWDQAELTRWHPGFAGKRSWSMVRRHLRQAADQKLANGSALLPRLYVPEVFTAEQKDQIAARRRSMWVTAAAQPSGRQQLLLLVGEVKEIQPGRHGYKAVIKHVPDIAFSMDEALFKSIERRFADELALWNVSDDVRVIAIAAFGLSKQGLPTIVSIHLMTVTRDWLPVDTAQEWELVSRLIEDQRSFSRILRYDARPEETMPCVALTDCGEHARLLAADGEEVEGSAPTEVVLHE